MALGRPSAFSRFWSWLRSSWLLATSPVGSWIRRTADDVLLMCCPPAPDARNTSIRMSDSSMSTPGGTLTSGVGLVLMGLSIRAAIDEGAGEFDMLWGTEPYKFLWARETRLLQRIELFPTHLGGTLHRHAIGARRSAGRPARASR